MEPEEDVEGAGTTGKSRGLGWLATDRGSRLWQVLWPGVIRFIQQSATRSPALVPETTHRQWGCSVSLSGSIPGHGTSSSAPSILCHTPTGLASEHRQLC